MEYKLTYKITLSTNHIKTDGTCSVKLQMFLNKQKKILPLNFSVQPKHFDKNKQRVKKGNPNANDYNLIIEKTIAEINEIQVTSRLSGEKLTAQEFLDRFLNLEKKVDFISFWENEMIRQKELLKFGTYRQQKSVLEKIKKFKNPIYFDEINEELIQDLTAYCRKKLKNSTPTIATTLKSFKKFLHIAQNRGIKCKMNFTQIKNKSFKGNRTFLLPEEINNLYTFWLQDYTNETYKDILSRFLFSCFTGLRISDLQKITKDNFINDILVFSVEKTEKIAQIPLNSSAKLFVGSKTVFNGKYTPEYMNRELKEIAKAVGITKKISFHVARHTFATNFLLCGGRVEVLQKLLGHSKIDETMIYVHIVENITNDQIMNMDEIIKNQ